MRLALIPVLLAFAFPCAAHDKPATPDPLPLDELSKLFNWKFEGAEITAEKIADNFYVLFGVGGNIAVTIGEDGVLIVDDQFPEVMPQIKAKIKALAAMALILQSTHTGISIMRRATWPWVPRVQYSYPISIPAT